MELNIKDLIKGTRFNFTKKDSYSVDEVYNLEEQLRNKIISEVGRKVEDYIQKLSETVALKEKELEDKEVILEKVTEEKQTFLKQIEDLTKAVEEKDGIVTKFVQKEKEKKAVELFGGLVAKKAEIDVFKLLDPKIEELDFTEETTLEEKRNKLQPLVEELVKTKPYFRPSDYNEGDNPSLLKSTTDRKENETVEDIPSDTGRVSYHPD